MALLEAPPAHIAPFSLAIPLLRISVKLQFQASLNINNLFLRRPFYLNTEFTIVTFYINWPNNLGFTLTEQLNVDYKSHITP